MKKVLFLATLLCAVAPVISGAQDLECTFCGPKAQTKTQSNFNASYINHRHIVTLEKGNKMIVEMFNIKDYDVLNDVGGVLRSFREHLKPLADSLETVPSGHVRIDYSYSTAAAYRKIRIKKYTPDGDLFLTNEGEVARLKVEQDTVRILVEKKAYYAYEGVEYKNYRPVQLTLVLNNYTDIDGLIDNKATLQHFIDTMAKVATPKYKVWPQNYKTTINFHPYPNAPERFAGEYRFIFFDGILSDEYSHIAWVSKYVSPRTFGFVADIGTGLTGSKLTPMAEAGIEWRRRSQRGGDMLMIKTSVTPYFIFDKRPNGKIELYDNWFVTAEAGMLTREENNAYIFKRKTIGAGYLVKANGNYLTGTTLKAFMHFPLTNQFVICPEVIVTDNFHKIFPAVTLKGFLNRFN